MNAPAGGGVDLPTPSLRRRLAAFLYEGVLVFGIVVGAGLVYGPLMNQRHALSAQPGLKAVIFFLLGAYFVWCWSRGGQTLAMKTWHVRLVTRHGNPVSPGRALARYLLSWVWFLPALAAVRAAELNSASEMLAAVAAGALGYAALSWLHPDRQFWHDAACGTRLVSWRVARNARAESVHGTPPS
jgi:uncharacterized RDD family membrane protein YckC